MRSNAGETEYRIALVTDRDDFSVKEIEKSILDELSPIINNIENNAWKPNEVNADLGTKVNIEFLLVVIPKENHGALETVLREALSKDDYDANIIEKSKQFIKIIS